MLHPVEYRSVIKFLVLRGVSNEQILTQLVEIYGSNCPSRTTIYHWIGLFKHGRESVFDEEKSGRPCEILEKCASIVREERRITTRKLADALNVSKGSLQAILKEMGIRKLASRFVV